ncbi:hypothetical protein FALCPG4_017181 [Fusarium falciforme]
MPLKVIVVGAGLGGLGAAVALHQAGHDVEVFEQSSFLNEVGAAIHIPPNATRVLKSWGCDLSSLKPVHCGFININNKDGSFKDLPVVKKDIQSRIGTYDEWLLAHRVDFHNALRQLATRKINGRQPVIHLASRVVSVDENAGEITLQDGTKRKADLLVGADGVHSCTTARVLGHEPQSKNTGQSCFRFLVPFDKVKAHPTVWPFFSTLDLSGQQVFVAHDRRLVIYLCRSGQILNVGGIHPTSDRVASAGDSLYQAAGQMDHLLETYKDFGPVLIEFLKLAEDLKLWNLATRDPPLSFHKGRLALLGDAAHPTLPHQGQGGAQAIEDAAAIGALFPAETRSDQVSERLALYNKVRYGRSVTVMFMSRIQDERREDMMDALREFVPDATLPSDMFAYTWASEPLRDAKVELQRLVREEGASAQL